MLHVTDDHSRVVLSSVDGDPLSDFINANYVDVSRCHVLVKETTKQLHKQHTNNKRKLQTKN